MRDSIAAEGESRNSRRSRNGPREGNIATAWEFMGKSKRMLLRLPVQGTFHAHRTLSQDVGVNHRRTHIGMAKQFLHRADVIARLQQVRCKAMPECMTTRGLSNACLADRRLHGTLHGSLVNVVSSRVSRIDIPAQRGGREYVLPAPLGREGRKFALQRLRQR